MIPIPEFGELHVISDLHLGGLPGFQIFDQGPLLERLLDHLRQWRPEVRLGLVINGDLVDFLAEPGASYFDPLGAGDKLTRITHDRAFAPVWHGLRRFVQAEKRTLVVILGNHDLELAMPWVREQLLQFLSGGDPAARGRVVLAFDGTGFRCRVGGASVLCLHGNEVDDWNVTDYEALRRMGRDLYRGWCRTDWTPNAGARLVVDVMNGIKKRYPFVDLLKPEVEAVIPTLLALKPELAVKIGAALPSFARRVWDAARLKAGFLAGKAGAAALGYGIEGGDAGAALEEMLGQTFGGDERGGAARFYEIDNLKYLLKETERHLIDGKEPLQLLGAAESPEFMGIIGAIRNLIARKGPSDVLREALERLARDLGFDVAAPDGAFLALDGLVGPDIDFLVAGHTHLERALPRSRPGRYYYNSGTWARLIHLTPELLGDKARFDAFYKAVAGTGGMAELDGIGVVLRRPAVVSIREEGGKVVGELRHAETSGDPPYSAVGGSRFDWS